MEEACFDLSRTEERHAQESMGSGIFGLTTNQSPEGFDRLVEAARGQVQGDALEDSASVQGQPAECFNRA